MAATASEMLPHVQMDPNPRVRWFRPDGCVEEGPDGTRWVYLAGTLLGCFTRQQPAERDILAVVLSGEKGVETGKLARAFGVSGETIRVAVARFEKGGFAALTEKRKRGAPTKQTPALVRRVHRLFEQGLNPHAVYRAIKGKVSDGTVRDMYRKWQAERTAEETQPDPATERAEVIALSLLERPANEDNVTPIDTEVVHGDEAKACASDDVIEPVAPPEADEAAGQRAEEARREMSLEEAVAHSQGQLVQHAGTWIMLGMLQAMGLYAVAKEACQGAVSQVALRLSLDAVAIALSIGQRYVEGVRRLATPSSALLLRAGGAISAAWTRRVLHKFAQSGSAQLHLAMARKYLQQALREDDRVVLYVDNHMRPCTGQHTLRKGWRMQDKRARPGVSDYYVHDESGRPLFRIDDPGHQSLTTWLRPVAEFVCSILGQHVTPVLAFDRGGAFPEEMSALRDVGVEFTTYERAPYTQLVPALFDRSVTLTRPSKPHEPVVVKFCQEHRKNLGKGRGRVDRISLLMPDGNQVNLLAASTLPPEEQIRIQLQRWACQENAFKHGNERWAINQLDGRNVEPYPADAIIPNPARNRLDRELRLARALEGQARSKLARLDQDDPKFEQIENDLGRALEQQQELEALRPQVPKRAPVRETELADELVYHSRAYKTVIDTLRIALANAESELAAELAPHLLKPREAKKTLANLLAAPGVVRLNTRTVTITLAPAATAREGNAFDALLRLVNARKLSLPGDPSRRRLRFKVQT